MEDSTGLIVTIVLGPIFLALLIGFLVHCFNEKKLLSSVQKPNKTVVAEPRSVPNTPIIASIDVMRSITNNFDEENVLGKGSFGTVYKGQLPDGLILAVKRMNPGAIVETGGGSEFQSEIDVMRKIRHQNLVSLLGYCLDGNERIIVYEYMPQGTLSRHIFNWQDEGLEPLAWNRRLIIALDVARGIEYLHSMAFQSFIHRDLKPSNILLGEDMRAKVTDFGLACLAPDDEASMEAKLAGAYGYMAPEYAVSGTKVDVFSFGVILMELITGRKALDKNQPEDDIRIVLWFHRTYLDLDSLRQMIDHTIDISEETLADIHTVAELARHCTAREPNQRPTMDNVVKVLFYQLSLSEALKKLKALDSFSSQ